MAKMRSTIQSLDNLFSSFKKEYKTIVGSLHPYHAFTVFCAKYFYFSDSSNDIDDDFLKCLPDGKNDGGIDAVFINPMEDTNELDMPKELIAASYGIIVRLCYYYTFFHYGDTM